MSQIVTFSRKKKSVVGHLFSKISLTSQSWSSGPAGSKWTRSDGRRAGGVGWPSPFASGIW